MYFVVRVFIWVVRRPRCYRAYVNNMHLRFSPLASLALPGNNRLLQKTKAGLGAQPLLGVLCGILPSVGLYLSYNGMKGMTRSVWGWSRAGFTDRLGNELPCPRGARRLGGTPNPPPIHPHGRGRHHPSQEQALVAVRHGQVVGRCGGGGACVLLEACVIVRGEGEVSDLFLVLASCSD